MALNNTKGYQSILLKIAALAIPPSLTFAPKNF